MCPSSVRTVKNGLLLSTVLVFISAPILVILSIFLPATASAATTYAWADTTLITRSDGTTYAQTTTDMTGAQLVIPSDEMVLVGTPGQGSTCGVGNHSSDFINSFNILPQNEQVLAKSSTSTTGTVDATFGESELIVIKPYLTATKATYITFQGGVAGSCEPSGQTISISPQAAQWTSSTTMSYLGNTFTGAGVNNGTMTLNGPNSLPNTSLCSPLVLTVGDANNSYLTATTATLTEITLQGSGHGQCSTNTQSIPIANNYISGNSGSSAQWMPGNVDPLAQIQITNVGSDAASLINKGDIYLEPSIPNQPAIKGTAMTLNRAINTSGACSKNTNEDHMVVDPYQTAQTATVTVYHNNGHACVSITLTVAITNGYGGTSTSGGGNNGPITTNGNCIVPDTSALSWLTCPILDLLKNAASAANSFIVSLLIFPVSQYFNSTMQGVFDIFRNIGVSMLVIAALVMVISQAADLELFAAHTVRKALPRIIIAAVAISLAWPLLQFVVTFFNDLGSWVGKIILSISNAANTNTCNANCTTGMVIGGIGDAILAVLGGATVFAILTVGGILSLLLSLVLLIGVGIFVLVMRQIVILLCILLAPIAIASFVLPGTEKFGHFWRETFLGALMMFPIITAFLAAGAAMAAITAAAKIGWYSLLAVLFYIAPYIMLPYAFRIAQGLMGRIIDLAQGTHHRTIESRLQKYRADEMAWKHQQRMDGRLNPRTPLGKSFDSLYRRVATRGGLDLMNNHYAEYNRKRMGMLAAKNIEADAGFMSGDDVATEYASKARNYNEFVNAYAADDRILNKKFGGNATAARDAAHRAARGFEASFNTTLGSQAAITSGFLARSQSVTGYSGDDVGLAELRDDGKRMIQNGYLSESDVIKSIKANQRRADQSAIGWGDWSKALNAAGNFSDINPRTGARSVNAVGNNFINEVGGMRDSAIDGAGPGQIAGGRKETVQALSARLGQRVNDLQAKVAGARASGVGVADAEGEYSRNIAKLAGIYDVMAQVAPQNAEVLAKGSRVNGTWVGGLLSNTTTDVHGRTGTIQEIIDANRNDPNFQKMRREYASQAAIQNQQNANAQAIAGGGAPGGLPNVGGQP